MFMPFAEHPPCMTSERDYICPDTSPEESILWGSSSASAAVDPSSTQDPSPDTPTSSATIVSDATTAAAAACVGMHSSEYASQYGLAWSTPDGSARANAVHTSSSSLASGQGPAAAAGAASSNSSSSSTSSSRCHSTSKQVMAITSAAAPGTAKAVKRSSTRHNAKLGPKRLPLKKRGSSKRANKPERSSAPPAATKTRTPTDKPGVYKLRSSGRYNVVLSVGTKKLLGLGTFDTLEQAGARCDVGHAFLDALKTTAELGGTDHKLLLLWGITAAGINNLAARATALKVPVLKHLPACKLYKGAAKQQPCFAVRLSAGLLEVLPVCGGCAGH